jgi:hypothetical protein
MAALWVIDGETAWQYEKTSSSEKRGEAVGWKRFRAEPLAVRIQTFHGHEDVRFCTIADLPQSKRPAFFYVESQASFK